MGQILKCLLAFACAASLPGQKFYPDDPLVVDDDKLDVPEKPAEIELSDMYDRFGHMFKDWGASAIGTEAANANTLDEVADSSWFTSLSGSSRSPKCMLCVGHTATHAGSRPWRTNACPSEAEGTTNSATSSKRRCAPTICTPSKR